jgi:hypothetical protein
VGEETLLEIVDNPSLIRRIITGFLELATASLRPLRRKAIRRRLLRDFMLLYIVVFLWLHFVGYRSWYPEFHRVRETFRASAITSIPLALFGTVCSYLLLLRERAWL